jgi:hypothetical protein
MLNNSSDIVRIETNPPMTRDILEIKKGIAQAKAALTLLEKFISEYEGRTVNILPCEDVRFYKANDEEIIVGEGVGALTSLNEAIRDCAAEMVAIQAVASGLPAEGE